LSSFIDATHAGALVASPGKAHLINLTNGKVERCVPFTGETVLGLGLIGNDKAFVYTGPAVVFLDLTAGKVLNALEVGPAYRAAAWGGAETRSCQRVGQRLYVSNGTGKGLAVVDLDKGKLLDPIAIPPGRAGIAHVVGDRALVYSSSTCYGVRTHVVNEFDLKTKKWSERQFTGLARPASSVLTAPNGTVYLVDDKQAHRCEANGQLTPVLSPKEPGRLVGFWGRTAIVVSGNQFKTVMLPRRPVVGAARK
jgi:hypothetical protein